MMLENTHEVPAVSYEDDRLAELMIYIAAKIVDDPRGGAVKLNKYLYFADFAAIRMLGRPISGAAYQKLPWGPAPRRLLPVRDRLLRNHDVELRRRYDAFGYAHDVVVPLREPDISVFTRNELQIVDEIIDELRPLSAAQISLVSHEDAAWQLVEEGETIPYELAFVQAPGEVIVTGAIRAEGERLLSESGDRLR